MTRSRTLILSAPAKLNLGLAVSGRRPDGFHDLVTIFQAVTILDTLTLSEQSPSYSRTVQQMTTFSCSDSSLAGPDNLVTRAIDLVRSVTGRADHLSVALTKVIPIASGLGGASSDAATTLIGLNDLWSLGLADSDMNGLAVALGSDVPFFLRGGCAFAVGRGERLRLLSNATAPWFVVVAPALATPIPRKTQSLFAALETGDMTTGEKVRHQAARLESGEALDPELLDNSFERPLYSLRPELERVRDALASAGAPFVAVSGAGPSHYTAVEKRGEAEGIAAAFRTLYSREAEVFVCTGQSSVKPRS